jgi:drug/metabolite transporter (DMT)-like permease
MVDWLLLVTPGIIWGASFLFIAEGLDAMAPNGVTFMRIAIGFLTLSLVPAARRPIRREDFRPTAALGLLWLAFPLSMFPFAERYVSSALTGMLNGATPLFAAIVAGIIARQFPSRPIVAGIAVGFSGAVIMALPDVGRESSANQFQSPSAPLPRFSPSARWAPALRICWRQPQPAGLGRRARRRPHF